MIRILQIIGSLERGGAETFLVNLYRNIDRDKVQFDFAIYEEPSEQGYYKEVLEFGARVFMLPPKSKGLVNNVKAISKIVRENGYQMVWRHTDSCIGAIDLTAARGGTALTVLHSHNSNAENLVSRILHYVIRPFLPLFVVKNYACGVEAGKWMYGRKPFEVINNGIDAEAFRYDRETRNRYRRELGVEDKIVVGHVGRFQPVKNHEFLIRIFEKVIAEKPNIVLALVGEGDLLPQIRKMVKENGLDENVLFLGVRDDVPRLLQMMDVFVMPSLFEGFPLAYLEAQAAGLPCVVSSAISREADVTAHTTFLDLNLPAESWADAILEKAGSKEPDCVEQVKQAEYDITEIARKVEKDILSMMRSKED